MRACTGHEMEFDPRPARPLSLHGGRVLNPMWLVSQSPSISWNHREKKKASGVLESVIKGEGGDF